MPEMPFELEDHWLISRALQMWQSVIETGNPVLSRQDAINSGQQDLVKPLDAQQKQFCQRLHELAVQYQRGTILSDLEKLLEDEGHSVTLLCNNPEADEQDYQAAVDVVGWHTDWNPRRYFGRTCQEAAGKAAAELRRREGSCHPQQGSEMSESKSRIWGQWVPEFFRGGATIVVQQEVPHKPHLCIYADVARTESEQTRARYQMCYDLAEFLNGGSRPAWLDDLHRDSEENAQALTGARIFATGPTVPDLEKPGRTVLDDSEGSKVDRARLMDVLFLISSKSSEDTPAEE